MLDWLACTFIRIFGALLCRLPPEVAVRLGERLGLLAYRLQSTRTHIGLLNVRAAFDGQLAPEQARRIIRDCYRQLGASAIELLRLPAVDRAYMERYVTFESLRYYDDAIASGRPVILLTAHYGNWEFSSIVSALLGRPIVALARPQNTFPKLYKLFVSYRESKGCIIAHKGGAMRRLFEALDQRQPVGIVGDQASRQGLFADLFGRPALFATGPFHLAYDKDALILPVFTHRVRGPFHRIVFEPPMTLSRQAEKAVAVRRGIEEFVQSLSRHIREDPGQWLWMHKRWKHTPARRALILSDGKVGHLKQSLTVLEALRERHPEITHGVIDIRYRSPLARGIALVWSWWMPRGFAAARCLRWTLAPDTASALLSRYADVIISCGAATVPANVLWAAENRAKSVVVMNPAPIPLRRFHLVIAPGHDELPRRPNVVRTAGALNRLREEALQEARHRLAAHPGYRPSTAMVHEHPVIGVFIGGDTADYELTTAFAEALVTQVTAVCEAIDGWCMVTTSRRTPPAVEQLLARRLGQHPRCRLLLIATRDPIDGTMEGMLGSADVAVVTGESISMVSEACASGRRVVVIEPPLRRSGRQILTKHQRFLRSLAKEGYASIAFMPELGRLIRRTLTERQAAKRLNDFATIRAAVARLL